MLAVLFAGAITLWNARQTFRERATGFTETSANMTEEGWLSGSDSDPMLDFVLEWKGGPSSRKMDLLSSACLRRILPALTDERSRNALAFLERRADGTATDDEGMSASRSALDGWGEAADAADAGHYATPLLCAMPDAGMAVWHAVDCDWQCIDGAAAAAAHLEAPILGRTPDKVRMPGDSEEWHAARERESAAQAELMRCIFGNPFHPIAFNPGWRSEAVVATAQSIYEKRAFDRMPELADALEAAGCTDSIILKHCRSQGPHARGCFVIDAILKKN
jgi:hypothetical protein